MEAYVLLIQTLYLNHYGWPGSQDVWERTKLKQNHGDLSQLFFFQKYGGLNFLLHCNYDSKFLKESEIPLFYRQMLANFLELRTLYQCNNGQDLILFNNKDILIN